MRRTALVALLLSIVAVLAAMSMSRADEPIRTKRFAVVNDAGKEVIVATVDKNGEAQFTILDSAGQTILRVANGAIEMRQPRYTTAVAKTPQTYPTRPKRPAKPEAREQRKPEVSLRSGVNASTADIELASTLKSLGWEYTMPRPKSSQASWGNSDGRTTWWNGYWVNRKTNRSSARTPSSSNDYKGDGIENRGWRRGGAPRRPTTIEWLCSTSGGIPPR